MDIFDLSAKITLNSSGYEDALNDAREKSSGFADKIKNGLSAAAKIGTAAVAAAGAGIAAIGKQALDAYANYEQLVGGVDTLFKDSSAKVQEYAANAFKTAGMSANEYMETVTSFSASLLQSLGGDTAAAAEVANMAITDMSDNANKMGTSMESIQNAYQGFAKQNYTMLDNLKLGYGGTKSEMERLLSDAEKLTGVKYDINNLNDVYSAIHAVQTELGITGTTAKEAATTISGSMGMLSSAWQNLLTGLADGNADVGALTGSVIESAQTVANNVIPVVEAMIPQISNAIFTLSDGLISQLASLGSTIVSSLSQSFMESLPTLLQTVLDAALEIVGAITDSIPQFADGVTQVITEIVGWLGEYAGVFAEAGVDLLVSVGNALTDADNIKTLIEAARILIEELFDAFIDAVPILIEAAPEMLKSLSDALIEEIPLILESVKNIVTAITDALGNRESIAALAQSAADIILQLGTALIDAVPALVDAALDIIMALADFLLDPDVLMPMLEAAIEIIISLGEALINALPQLIDAAVEIIVSLIDFLLDPDNLDKIAKMALELIVAIANGLIIAIPRLLEAAVEIVAELLKKFKETDWAQIGKDLIEGFKKGVSDAWEGLKEWFGEKWDGLVGGVKDLLGIHSPSTVFAEIGENINRGLQEGLENTFSEVASVVDAEANYIIGSVNGVMQALRQLSSYGESMSSFGEKVENFYTYGEGTQGGIFVGAANEAVLNTLKNPNQGNWYSDAGFNFPNGSPPGVTITQNIYAQAMTPAQAFEEAAYSQQKLALMGV